MTQDDLFEKWYEKHLQTIGPVLSPRDYCHLVFRAGRIAQRDLDAGVADELGEYWSGYKDTALLNGDIALANAASGEPRAAEKIAEAIRSQEI